MNPLIVFITLLCSVRYSVAKYQDYVIELTDKNFKHKIGTYETSLVMFYAPWCGHCKNLKPEFTKAAQILSKYKDQVSFIKVNCIEEGSETCNYYDIGGYPTLKIIKTEYTEEYQGPRDAKGMAEHMKLQMGPISQELKTVEEVENLINNAPVICVLGFFETNSTLKKRFFSIAAELRSTTKFGHITSILVLSYYAYRNHVALYRPRIFRNKFENFKIVFMDKDENNLRKFIRSKSHGLVGYRKTENLKDFIVPLVVVYYDVDYVKNPKSTNYWRNRILQVAKHFKNKFYFAISSITEFAQELSDAGIDMRSISDKPVAIAWNTKKQRFVMPESFSTEALHDFVDNIITEKTPVTMKSQPVITNNHPLQVVVAKNFYEIVIDNDMDTMIEFYAPWCGHCKKLAPVYEKVAEKLRNEEVAIVKMDATANDIPSLFKIEGYPSVFWLGRKMKNDPKPYRGERTVDGFIKYIAKHATEPLKQFDRRGKSRIKDKEDL